VRGIHAPIAQSNDEKLLLADAILGFRNVPACTFQGRFLSFHTTPPREVCEAQRAYFVPPPPSGQFRSRTRACLPCARSSRLARM
jgi:hypothetical protein